MGKKMTESQSKKFVNKAHELGCEEDAAVFEEKLKRLAKAKPKKEAPKE